ncbi:MAG: CRTAC1 family protein [Bryobacteraceae bacterium]
MLLFLLAAVEPPRAPQYVDDGVAAGLTTPQVYGARGRQSYILESTGTGAAIFDFDRDGRNDIFLASGTRFDASEASPPQLYRNLGNGRFADVAREAGLTKTGWAQAVCVADYDNDGHSDLLVTYYGQNTLYRNRGDRTFEDVTSKAGLDDHSSPPRWGAGCVFFDYDRDGFVDLFVANYVTLDLAKTPRPGQDPSCRWKGLDVWCGPNGLPKSHNVLYRNNRDGTFADVSAKAGIPKPGGRHALGAAAADFDNDGWPDLYVACDQTPSLLYHNQRDSTFRERGAEAGVAFNFDGRLQAGMGVAVADYDRNGFLDIAKTNFSGDLPSLYNNEDGRFFSDLSQSAGLGANQLLGWGVAFLDADEDGLPDLLLANGHVYPEVDTARLGDTYLQKMLFYRNLGGGRFADQTAESGSALSVPRPARGLATGDLDGDGHPEVVVVNMNGRPSLLRNTAPRRSSVSISLEGRKSNRSAIGARVIVEAGGARQVQEVASGGSYYSQNALALHFGLGAARRITRLEIRWPSGLVQTVRDVAVNARLHIVEGNPVTTVAYPPSSTKQ